MGEWMALFSSVLQYRNADLVDPDEDNEPGPLEALQTAVIENINIYVEKYEEEFLSHMGTFIGCIWQLLLEVGPQAKFDSLAIYGIKFLTTLGSKQMHVGLFSDQVLSEIVQHIVVKNLTATEADMELFEGNPIDYIRKDIEGSDQDTRRRCAVELVRSLLRFFGPQVSSLSEGYVPLPACLPACLPARSIIIPPFPPPTNPVPAHNLPPPPHLPPQVHHTHDVAIPKHGQLEAQGRRAASAPRLGRHQHVM